MTIAQASYRIQRLERVGEVAQCTTDAGVILIPAAPAAYLHRGDDLSAVPGASPVTEFLAARSKGNQKLPSVYYSRVGYITQPKIDKRDQQFLRAEVLDSSLGITSVHLPGSAVRDYFYFFARRADGEVSNLYEVLGVSRDVSFADLRLSYKVRRLELMAQASNELRSVERAYNLLSHPELRSCYDQLLLDPDAPAFWPYGGFGSLTVSGYLEGDTFFVRKLLAYTPNKTERSFRAALRQIEFYDGYALYKDSRRRAEVYLDPMALPLAWDPTWNSWKHFIPTKVGISGTFVESPKYRWRERDWHLVRWQTALPSRVTVSVPSHATDEIAAARRLHQRFGDYCQVIEQLRATLERKPMEEGDLAEMCRAHRVPSDFDVSLLCWKPNYDRFFYQQLKRRSVVVFLFRGEYIFELGTKVVAEVPQVGNATYVFARSNNIRDFVQRYAATTRDHIRKNWNNVATDLGFITRISHGSNRKNWLRTLRTVIGEPNDYSLAAADGSN